MAEAETVNVTLDDLKIGCQLLSLTQVSQLWQAKVRCPDGSTRTARTANKNAAKQLACLKCEDALSE